MRLEQCAHISIVRFKGNCGRRASRRSTRSLKLFHDVVIFSSWRDTWLRMQRDATCGGRHATIDHVHTRDQIPMQWLRYLCLLLSFCNWLFLFLILFFLSLFLFLYLSSGNRTVFLNQVNAATRNALPPIIFRQDRRIDRGPRTDNKPWAGWWTTTSWDTNCSSLIIEQLATLWTTPVFNDSCLCFRLLIISLKRLVKECVEYEY